MKKLIIAALLVCLVTPAWAANSKGQYEILGYGNNSCGTWTKHRKAGAWYGTAGWVLGIVTGYNAYTDGVYNIAEGTDNQGLLAWIDNYCSSNPLEKVLAATNALVEHLKTR